eukprot:1095106-Pelagomonas_calceolata.AAC.2
MVVGLELSRAKCSRPPRSAWTLVTWGTGCLVAWLLLAAAGVCAGPDEGPKGEHKMLAWLLLPAAGARHSSSRVDKLGKPHSTAWRSKASPICQAAVFALCSLAAAAAAACTTPAACARPAAGEEAGQLAASGSLRCSQCPRSTT